MYQIKGTIGKDVQDTVNIWKLPTVEYCRKVNTELNTIDRQKLQLDGTFRFVHIEGRGVTCRRVEVIDRLIDRWIDGWMDRCMDGRAGRPAGRQAGRQTHRQAHT